MPQLGHVVFYVKQLERSVQFYTDVVGLDVQGKIFNGKAALLTGGSTHHELLLIEVAEADGPLRGKRIGLYHVGWKLGDSIELLKQAYNRVIEMSIDIQGMSDHTVSQSLYLLDPDGNEIELYVDNPDFDWQQDKSWMEAPIKPLRF
ncbi:MAG: VOC family protein [Gammaproteobacteria bacterium]